MPASKKVVSSCVNK